MVRFYAKPSTKFSILLGTFRPTSTTSYARLSTKLCTCTRVQSLRVNYSCMPHARKADPTSAYNFARAVSEIHRVCAHMYSFLLTSLLYNAWYQILYMSDSRTGGTRVSTVSLAGQPPADFNTSGSCMLIPRGDPRIKMRISNLAF